MSVKITRSDQFGHDMSGAPASLLATKVAQQSARALALASTGLTDNSGGTATTPKTISKLTDFTVAAASGSSLANGSNFAASLVKVRDAIAEIAAKAKAIALLTGAPVAVYDGSFSNAPDGTIGALDVAATGAATGPTAASVAGLTAAYNTAFYGLAGLINGIAASTGISGVQPLPLSWGLSYTTIPGAALPVTISASASPGVTLASATAWLLQAAANVATLAAKLNEVAGAVTVLTDNSGGVANVYGTVVAVGSNVADSDVSGGTGSTSATLHTSLVGVVNSVASLVARTNAVASRLDISPVAYTGGGSVATTLAAVCDSGALGATGATKATLDPIFAALDKAFASVGATVNSALARLNLAPLAVEYTATVADPGTIATTATFAGTGQTKAAVDAALVVYAANIATLSATINAAVARVNGPFVVIEK